MVSRPGSLRWRTKCSSSTLSKTGHCSDDWTSIAVVLVSSRTPPSTPRASQGRLRRARKASTKESATAASAPPRNSAESQPPGSSSYSGTTVNDTTCPPRITLSGVGLPARLLTRSIN